MRRVKSFLRTVGEKVKKVLTHKSKGYNDMKAITLTVLVAVTVIGEYFLAQLLDALNYDEYKYPLLVVVAAILVAFIIVVILRN